MIYLACPYKHVSVAIKEARYRAVLEATAFFMRQDEIIFSPIVHNHPIAMTFNFPDNFHYWQKVDLHILSRCDKLWILQLEGWDQSVGVAWETKHAICNNIPVQYVRASDYTVSPLRR